MVGSEKLSDNLDIVLVIIMITYMVTHYTVQW